MMYLAVSRADKSFAEVYSIQKSKTSGERQHGIFLWPGSPREHEEYAESVDQAADLLFSASEYGKSGGAQIVIPTIDNAIATKD